MSSGDLYGRNVREIGAAKRVRCERLRPIRAAIADYDLPCSLRMHGADSEKAWLEGHVLAVRPLEIDLREPFDIAAVIDYLYDALDRHDEYLDGIRGRIRVADERFSTERAECGGAT